MIKSVIVAVYILFSHNGGVATTTEINHWTQSQCETMVKQSVYDYEDTHKGDKVVAICLPVYRGGI